MYQTCREVTLLIFPALRGRSDRGRVGSMGRGGDGGAAMSSATEAALAVAGGLALGAGMMYLLDPDRGNRRRGILRDKAYSAVRHAGTTASKTARYTRNRARGIAAETAARFRHEEVSDEQLRERVRSAMGRAVSHPGAIEVTAHEGVVTLRGQVLSDEVDDLIGTVSSVRGVEAVDNQLQERERPAGEPSLQGEGQTSEEYDLLQAYWSPSTRLLLGTLGLGLAGWAMARRDTAGIALGAIGASLLARSATNLDASRLTGLGAGPDAVEVRKTININAPVERVFEYWSNYENFPRFMRNVREVRDLGGGRSRWTVAGPAGVPVSWEARITHYEPGSLIGWKSEEGSIVANTGMVHFQPNEQGGTRVDVRLAYNPVAGALGHAVALLFGADPKSEMDQDLLRMKTHIETGKTPHDAAQPAGA